MIFTTKFDVCNRAWFMKNNRPTEMIISAIQTFISEKETLVKYNGWDVLDRKTWIDHHDIQENILYPSKEDLIKSL
jgi:hypothetical protein